MRSDLPRVLKALSDPTRLKIFEMLLGSEMCVCEIVAKLNLSQPLVSHHLRELKIANLVVDRRQGNWVHYRLNTQSVARIKEKLEGLFSQVSENPKISQYRCAATKEEELANAE
ncbi:MAG: ArsR/SmtB family transcription factor [Candidatus Aquicultorales bacterium]